MLSSGSSSASSSSSFPPPNLDSFANLLQNVLPLSIGTVDAHLNKDRLAIQACKKGKRLLASSQVRNIFHEVLTCTGDGDMTIFVGSLVESEFINTGYVYLTYCFLNRSQIISSNCTCVAENRTIGACKHRAALLYSIHIIQSRLFIVAPKDFRTSQRTIQNLRGSTPETYEKFRVWPWTHTVSLMFEKWPLEMKKKFVLMPLPPPQRGKQTTPPPITYSSLDILPEIVRSIFEKFRAASDLLLPLPSVSISPQSPQHVESSESLLAPINDTPNLSITPPDTSSQLPPMFSSLPLVLETSYVSKKRVFRGPSHDESEAYYTSKRGRKCFKKNHEDE